MTKFIKDQLLVTAQQRHNEISADIERRKLEDRTKHTMLQAFGAGIKAASPHTAEGSLSDWIFAEKDDGVAPKKDILMVSKEEAAEQGVHIDESEVDILKFGTLKQIQHDREKLAEGFQSATDSGTINTVAAWTGFFTAFAFNPTGIAMGAAAGSAIPYVGTALGAVVGGARNVVKFAEAARALNKVTKAIKKVPTAVDGIVQSKRMQGMLRGGKKILDENSKLRKAYSLTKTVGKGVGGTVVTGAKKTVDIGKAIITKDKKLAQIAVAQGVGNALEEMVIGRIQSKVGNKYNIESQMMMAFFAPTLLIGGAVAMGRSVRAIAKSRAAKTLIKEPAKKLQKVDPKTQLKKDVEDLKNEFVMMEKEGKQLNQAEMEGMLLNPEKYNTEGVETSFQRNKRYKPEVIAEVLRGKLDELDVGREKTLILEELGKTEHLIALRKQFGANELDELIVNEITGQLMTNHKIDLEGLHPWLVSKKAWAEKQAQYLAAKNIPEQAASRPGFWKGKAKEMFEVSEDDFKAWSQKTQRVDDVQPVVESKGTVKGITEDAHNKQILTEAKQSADPLARELAKVSDEIDSSYDNLVNCLAGQTETKPKDKVKSDKGKPELKVVKDKDETKKPASKDKTAEDKTMNRYELFAAAVKKRNTDGALLPFPKTKKTEALKKKNKDARQKAIKDKQMEEALKMERAPWEETVKSADKLKENKSGLRQLKLIRGGKKKKKGDE